MKIKVHKENFKSNSSRRWVERQLNDPFVLEAKKQGFRSRAAFKLAEIDDKFRLIKKSSKIIDLGAAPGGWSQVISTRANLSGGAKVVAVDLLEMPVLNGVKFILGDFNDEEIITEIMKSISGRPDLIVSDMAPNTIGHAKTDHIRMMALVEIAAEFAMDNLQKGGSFVAKVFQGGGERQLLLKLKQNFEKVVHFKPKSSRKESSELYMISLNFRGKEVVQ